MFSGDIDACAIRTNLLIADVVIGAPYEDDNRGAIYIYLGSSQGLKDQYVQRVSPSDFRVNLLNFGRSLASRVDVDHNLYPGLNQLYVIRNAAACRIR
jgi:hypothetical protein